MLCKSVCLVSDGSLRFALFRPNLFLQRRMVLVQDGCWRLGGVGVTDPSGRVGRGGYEKRRARRRLRKDAEVKVTTKVRQLVRVDPDS